MVGPGSDGFFGGAAAPPTGRGGVIGRGDVDGRGVVAAGRAWGAACGRRLDEPAGREPWADDGLPADGDLDGAEAGEASPGVLERLAAPLATARAAALSAGVVFNGRVGLAGTGAPGFAELGLADFDAGRAEDAGGREPEELGAAGAEADLAGGWVRTVGAAEGASDVDGEAVAGRAPTGRTRVVAASSPELRPSSEPLAVTLGDASAVIGDAPPPGFGGGVTSGP
jgi:hypothetical protein